MTPTDRQLREAEKQASKAWRRYTEDGGVNEAWLVEYKKALQKILERDQEKSP